MRPCARGYEVAVFLFLTSGLLGGARADEDPRLSRYFSYLDDTASPPIGLTAKRNLLASFATGVVLEGNPGLVLTKEDVLTDAGFQGLKKLASSTTVHEIIGRDARKLLGVIPDSRAVEILNELTQAEGAAEAFRIESASALGAQAASGSVVAAEYLADLGMNSPSIPLKDAARRYITQLQSSKVVPTSSLFLFLKSRSQVVKNVGRTALQNRNALDENLYEKDLLAIAEIRDRRQQLFENSIASTEVLVDAYRKKLAAAKRGELVVPPVFSLLMGEMPKDPQTGLRHAQFEIKRLRAESARLARLLPLEYCVELVAACCELSTVRAKLDKQLKQINEGTALIDSLRDVILPIELTEAEIEFARSQGDLDPGIDSSGVAANLMVRGMLAAAAEEAKARADANSKAFSAQVKLLRRDLKSLSPDAITLAKLAYVERLAGRSVKVVSSEKPQAPKPDPPSPPSPEAPALVESLPASPPSPQFGTHSQLTNGSFKNGLDGWNQEGDATDFLIYDERVNTYGKTLKEGAKGKIWQAFKVHPKAAQLIFEVSCGRGRGILVNLVVDGKTVESVTGKNSKERQEIVWDLMDHREKVVTLQIVDNSKGPWQFIAAGKFRVLYEPSK